MTWRPMDITALAICLIINSSVRKAIKRGPWGPKHAAHASNNPFTAPPPQILITWRVISTLRGLPWSSQKCNGEPFWRIMELAYQLPEPAPRDRKQTELWLDKNHTTIQLNKMYKWINRILKQAFRLPFTRPNIFFYKLLCYSSMRSKVRRFKPRARDFNLWVRIWNFFH